MNVHRDHMANPAYAQSFVDAWLAEGARGHRYILWAAEQQHANLKQLLWERRRYRRVPHWCKLHDYIKAVRIVRAAARDIRRNAMRFDWKDAKVLDRVYVVLPSGERTAATVVRITATQIITDYSPTPRFRRKDGLAVGVFKNPPWTRLARP